ncbi:hypothetical protein DSM104443_03095 [Usitatibacter rugosus]|uniref:Uncharacterized protein n=1 Tax=Usitatibacter rugosus TaxID=2732067 RepID=A0A6M4GYC0_9PROT|nr:hypothetical protein [Usitatibacter rugosus]QJR12012.1 hypothetical protein DSM104443_03095 [Usitatibacter rugosus]
MTASPDTEPPIDVSLSYYMEERALAIALEKAPAGLQRGKIERLIELRSALMRHRDTHTQEAVAKRHARGEIYSKSRVAAINAMMPDKASQDESVATLYLRQPDAEGVLKMHARTSFAYVLVSQRLMVKDHTPDMVEGARVIQEHEERFARAWIAAVGDKSFESEMRERQREAIATLRTSTRAMFFVSYPANELDDEDARELGKAWTKLDKLAESLGHKALSSFIALDEEGESASVPAGELVPVIEALISAVENPAERLPSKRKVVAVLGKLRAMLVSLEEKGGRAHFEVDL